MNAELIVGLILVSVSAVVLMRALAVNYRWLYRSEILHRRKKRHWDDFDDDPRQDSFKPR